MVAEESNLHYLWHGDSVKKLTVSVLPDPLAKCRGAKSTLVLACTSTPALLTNKLTVFLLAGGFVGT
jgi:hypothetical protein